MSIHNSKRKHSLIALIMCVLVLALSGCGRGNGNYNQVTEVDRVSSQQAFYQSINCWTAESNIQFMCPCVGRRRTYLDLNKPENILIFHVSPFR